MSPTTPAPRRLVKATIAAVFTVSIAPGAARDGDGSPGTAHHRPFGHRLGARLPGRRPRPGGVCKPDSARRIRSLPDRLEELNRRLLAGCRFRHVQAAVDAVREPSTRILLLPGVYREEPSLKAPASECALLAGHELLSYEEHAAARTCRT